MKIILSICALVWTLASESTWAASDGSTYEWLAQTARIRSNAGDDGSLHKAIWQIRSGQLQRVSGNHDSIEIQRLNAGQWKRIDTSFPKLENGRRFSIVASFDQRLTYVWRFEKTLKIASLGQSGQARALFEITDESIQNLFNTQGAGELLGDEKYGFWVVNSYLGEGVFIEPNSWVLRSVPGLSKKKDSAANGKLFDSATLGKDGTLWTLERDGMQLVRRNTSGKELVRVTAPFPIKNTSPDFAGNGSGTLAPSIAGVVVISGTRLEIASFNHEGRELWRTSMCPNSLTADCAEVSQLNGQQGTIFEAVGDEQGDVYAGDFSRIFVYRGGAPAQRTMLSGTLPLCKLTQAVGAAFQPCVGDDHRAVPLAPNRWLVFALNPAIYAPFELQVIPGLKPTFTFKLLLSQLMDQPLSIRQSIFELASDLRAWPRNTTNDSQTIAIGVPTASGIISARTVMSKYLSPPGDAIRTPADKELSELFGEGQQHLFPGARLGQNGVVIKDYRSLTTKIALYNASDKTLQQRLIIKGLPKVTLCTEMDTRDEYLFNDDRNQLYLLRGRSGEVYAIDERLNAKFVARTPEITGAPADPCGPSRSLGSVQSAIQLPTGRLIIATASLLLQQDGTSFFVVEAPDRINQIIPVDSEQVLVLAGGGLAKIQLPKTFTSPSLVSADKAGVVSLPDCNCGNSPR